MDSPDNLADEVAAANDEATETHQAFASFHGSGLLPAECLTPDPDGWLDASPQCVDEEVWRLMEDLRDAKRGGDAADIVKALDALEA